MFTTMTMNPAALHLDFDYAEKETQFGQPLVNSMFTAALVVGISVHETTHGTTVANLGFEEMNLSPAWIVSLNSRLQALLGSLVLLG